THQAANRRRTPCNETAVADTRRQQTPRSEALSKHCRWSRDGDACVPKTEVMGEPRPLRGAALLGAADHVLHGLVDPLATFNVLQVQPTPDNAVVVNAEDGDPAHVQAGPVGAGALPVPLGPPGV